MILRLFLLGVAFWRYRLDLLIPASRRPRLLKGVQAILGSLGTAKSAGARLADALEAQGVAAVKLGQILSNRPDLLSPEVTTHIARLRADCAPVPFAAISKTMESELEKPIGELFVSLDPKQIATASLAQVHRGVIDTPQGKRDVAVKVLKPGVERIVERDIRWIRKFITFIESRYQLLQQIGISDVLGEFEAGLRGELDLRAEAANTMRCHRQFEGSQLLLVPEVFEDYTARSVMVMEWVDAVSINDRQALADAEVDLRRLAEDGVEIFAAQVYDNNFFHGDMHPGNILVQPGKPGETRAKYVQLDMAVAGSLSRHDTIFVVQLLRTLMRGDYDACARVLIMAGVSSEPTSQGALSRKLAQVCGPMLDRPIGEIRIGLLLMGLFEAARELHLRLPHSLALLGRTIFNIEGMGRELYPELDFWSILRPRLDEWAKVNFGPQKLMREVRDLIPLLAMRFSEGALQDSPFSNRQSPAPPARDRHRQRRKKAVQGVLMSWTIAGVGVGVALIPGLEVVGGVVIAISWLAFARVLIR